MRDICRATGRIHLDVQTGRYEEAVTDASNSTPSLPQLVLEQLANAQEQLDSIKEQLAESQRLATIGTISAVIAHEFNNLLTPIISYSQYALQSAQSEKPDMPLICKALTKAAGSATKAGQICSSMLSLARGESSMAEISVQKLVDEVLLVLARDPQKDGIALRVQVQPDAIAMGDPVQLEQVLLNLVINARQAMLGKGGSLTVKAGIIDSEVRLQVIDTGPGISEKNIGRIFEPFFTTKGTAHRGEAKGTGLGLAICKQIVERHNGRIEVFSEIGKGATFSVYLPAAIRKKRPELAAS
jgi:signal transduction histidine kinase